MKIAGGSYQASNIRLVASCKPDMAEQQEQKGFYEMLDALKECDSDRQRRMKDEAKRAAAKRTKERKVNQLKGRIAYLRSRLMANRHDKKAQGELAMAKCQLYWLSNPLSLDVD